MNLSELKRRENELRHRLGDERYEQMYIRQQRAEAVRKPAAAPAITYKKPVSSTPSAAPASGRIDNMFYTNRPDSGIIPNKPAIADIRKGIEDLNKKIESLNKQQYNTMLSGDDRKTAEYDIIIKNAENQRDALKVQMARAMGIGNESADKDVLRAGGGSGEKPTSGVDNYKQTIGLNDEKEGALRPLEYPQTDTFEDYINREDFGNINDYYKTVADHASVYLKNGDREGFKKFLEKNRVNSGLEMSLIGMNLNKQFEEESIKHEISAGSSDKKPVPYQITDDGEVKKIDTEYFKTLDEAAIYWAKQYYQGSLDTGLENGAVIYQNVIDGSCFFGPLYTGDKGGVPQIAFESILTNLAQPLSASGSFVRIVGTIHTHPYEASPSISADDPSYGYLSNNAFSSPDMFWLPGTSYLCAPNGVLYKNNNRWESNEIVYTGLPTYDNDPMDAKPYTNAPTLFNWGDYGPPPEPQSPPQ